MSRELLVLWAGRHRRNEWDELCSRYRGRIAKSVKLAEIPVKSRGSSSAENRLKLEGEALLAAIPDPAFVVALDRRGKSRSSIELAQWLRELQIQWPHPIAFVLGSDLGLDQAVLKRAQERLSLGPLTLPHDLARLVLYEQIYRSFCILAGIKYHREPL